MVLHLPLLQVGWVAEEGSPTLTFELKNLLEYTATTGIYRCNLRVGIYHDLGECPLVMPHPFSRTSI